MDLKAVAQGEAWMGKAEQTWNRGFVGAARRVLKRRGVQESPFLALRVRELGTCCLLLMRLERLLHEALEKTEDEEKRMRLLATAMDALGKAWERLRKAMRELEEYCAKTGIPVDTGLAEIMQPILKKAEGIIEEATQRKAEEKRQRLAC